MSLKELAQYLIGQLPYSWRFVSFQLATEAEYVIRIHAAGEGDFDLAIRRAS